MAPSAQVKKPRKRRISPEHYDRVSTMLIAMVPYPMIEKQLSLEWTEKAKQAGTPRTYSKAYVQEIIKAVHADWAYSASLAADSRRHAIRHSFETLYMKANQNKDINAAARILHELGTLDGCYAKTQIEMTHSGNVGVGISLGTLGFKSPEEVKGRIEYLKDRLASEGPGMLNRNYQDASTAQALGLPSPDGVCIDVPDNEDPGGEQPP